MLSTVALSIAANGRQPLLDTVGRQAQVDTRMRRRKRRPKYRETLDYLGMVRRMIRAGGRRCADADEAELAALIGLRAEVDLAVDDAVRGLRARGLSWGWIGQGLGMSRQAAQQRWGGEAA